VPNKRFERTLASVVILSALQRRSSAIR